MIATPIHLLSVGIMFHLPVTHWLEIYCQRLTDVFLAIRVVGCGCSWIQDNSMVLDSPTSNVLLTSKKCSALPSKTVDVSSVSDLFEFICSGPLVDKIGITPDSVGQSIDKWLLYGSQLCRLFQLNELMLTIPQKARLYHYYIPVFVWCQDQIALHTSKFNDGDDVPPLVVPIVFFFFLFLVIVFIWWIKRFDQM